jgi:hypothetical protein
VDRSFGLAAWAFERKTTFATTAVRRFVMKVQATVLLNFQAKTLAEAGAVLDDVLARAHQRNDVDVGGVELVSPPGDRGVTLPPVAAPATPGRHTPASA